MKIAVRDMASINDAAREFVANIKPDKTIYAFYGKMGAGKTTFIKAVCEVFAIVNVYHSPGRGEIDHFDFYRIKKIDEVYDMGFEDYFYSGNLCFIEWPELVESLLPDDAVRVIVTDNGDGTRSIEF